MGHSGNSPADYSHQPYKLRYVHCKFLIDPTKAGSQRLTREQALICSVYFPYGMSFFLPFTITNALSVVIIPNLAESRALNRWQDIKSKINRAIQLTCYIAFHSAALLEELGGLIGDLLYRQPLVATLLIPLSYALPIHALQHTSSSILNGLGRQNQAAAHFIAGSFIQLICTWFLAANPAINIWGMVIVHLKQSDGLHCQSSYFA